MVWPRGKGVEDGGCSGVGSGVGVIRHQDLENFAKLVSYFIGPTHMRSDIECKPGHSAMEND